MVVHLLLLKGSIHKYNFSSLGSPIRKEFQLPLTSDLQAELQNIVSLVFSTKVEDKATSAITAKGQLTKY